MINNKNRWTQAAPIEISRGSFTQVQDNFLPNVFAFMSLGLLISGFLAYLFGNNPSLTSLLFNANGSGYSIFGYIAMFGPLVFGMTMSLAYQKLSPMALLLLFIGYAGLLGCSMGTLFLVYSPLVIVKAFSATAVTFVVMAVMGYTTKTDLSKMGSILGMVLIGILVASLINLFMKSSAFDYLISMLGVLVFTGLTAYDMQQLKEMSRYDMADKNKLAIMGAFKLYLDFINLFIFILRLFGNKRED